MARSVVDVQLARARRRLFLEALFARLAWAWVAALLLAAGWFLAQPSLFPGAPRWIVAAGLIAGASLAALVVTITRAPTPATAALTLDERFGLNERVTTSLLLTPDEAGSPAGQALLADASTCLQRIRVSERFPLAMPWKPVAGAGVILVALVLLGVYWKAKPAGESADDDSLAVAPEYQATVEQQMKKLAAQSRGDKKKKDEQKPPALARLDDRIEKFVRMPRKTPEDMRERVKDSTNLIDDIKAQKKAVARRMDDLRKELAQANKVTAKKDKAPDKANPAKGGGALDPRKAEDEFNRLRAQMEKQEKKKELEKKANDPQANPAERKKAEDELKKMKDQGKEGEAEKRMEELKEQLKFAAKNKEEKKQEIDDREKKGDLSKEEAKKARDEIEQNGDKMSKEDRQAMKEIAEKLGECQKCMKEARSAEGKQQQAEAKKKLAEAKKNLDQAAKKAGQLGDKQQSKELDQKLAQVEAVKKALCQGAKGGGIGAGKRPEEDRGETASKETQVKGQQDKGQIEIVGDASGGGFKGAFKPGDAPEEVKKAAQEGSAAVDRQPIAAPARKMAKSFFEKMRKQSGK